MSDSPSDRPFFHSDEQRNFAPSPNKNSGQEHHGHPHVHDHGHDHGLRFLSPLIGFIKHSHAKTDFSASAIDTSSEGIRALKVSLIGLGLTAVIQLLVVIVSGSIALFSESIHNFADALTALPLGIAFVVAKKKPNLRYTYGYGRAEDLAGIFIVLVITASSLTALFESISRLIHPHEIHQIPAVILAGIVGFLGNEGVAIYRIRVGTRIGSAALTADGLHARSDGLASLAVVLGGIGVIFGFRQADPIASLLVGVAVFGILRTATRDIYRRLMDSVDPILVQKVRGVLLSTPGIEGIEAVHIRWIGHQLRAEADILSDANLSLVESHLIAEDAHHRLLHEIPRLSEAVIHTSPMHRDGNSAHPNIAHHFPQNPPVA